MLSAILTPYAVLERKSFSAGLAKFLLIYMYIVFQYLITFLNFIIKIETFMEIGYNSTSFPFNTMICSVLSNYHCMIDTYFSNGNGNENIRTEDDWKHLLFVIFSAMTVKYTYTYIIYQKN